ncbi:MAG: 1-deoxy-D-xylulose-5-phosphate synthase, partial [Candidatus Omnitrophica bacterium]|nr:1-deoxy-D-xylulose-5-phosphate synthase [Candidatus Omnitrophota bacterium]
LAKDKISVGLVNARFIKPLDESLLAKLFKQYRIIVTVEEGAVIGGWGQEVSACYFREDYSFKTKIVNLGLPDQFIPAGKRKELFCQYGLDAKSLAKKIKALITK